jgi:hypothetical protein
VFIELDQILRNHLKMLSNGFQQGQELNVVLKTNFSDVFFLKNRSATMEDKMDVERGGGGDRGGGDDRPKRIPGMPRATRVKNKAPAPVQITAEQILREAMERQDAESKPPKQHITDPEEVCVTQKIFLTLCLRNSWQSSD